MKSIDPDPVRYVRFPPIFKRDTTGRVRTARGGWPLSPTTLRVHLTSLGRLLSSLVARCSPVTVNTESNTPQDEARPIDPSMTEQPASTFFTQRRPLPGRREDNINQKFTVIDHKGHHSMHFTLGFYPDTGLPAEIFATLSKTGSEERAFLDAMARAVSLGLQHGVPLHSWVEMFVDTQGSPAGTVAGHPNIKRCRGPIDLLFRWLGFEFCGMNELAQVQTPPATSTERTY